MAQVEIKGKFMGANLDTRTFQGNSKTTLLIDLYQSKSPLKNKAVQVRSDELDKLMDFKEYAEGDEITLICNVTAYQNDPTFRLVSIA